jgi:hypothetical protein
VTFSLYFEFLSLFGFFLFPLIFLFLCLSFFVFFHFLQLSSLYQFHFHPETLFSLCFFLIWLWVLFSLLFPFFFYFLLFHLLAHFYKIKLSFPSISLGIFFFYLSFYCFLLCQSIYLYGWSLNKLSWWNDYNPWFS